MPDTQEQTDEHPIIFNGWSIRRIFAGEKSETRRIVKPQPPYQEDITSYSLSDPLQARWKYTGLRGKTQRDDFIVDVPYQTGDVLWVREAFRLPALAEGMSPSEYVACRQPPIVKYEADGSTHGDEGPTGSPKRGWGRKRPSIHLPRELCRLRLRVEDVRVERLQEISDEDVDAEGVPNTCDPDGAPWRNWKTVDGLETNFARIAFRTLWNDIHGTGAWEENPHVWVVEFSKIDAESDPQRAINETLRNVRSRIGDQFEKIERRRDQKGDATDAPRLSAKMEGYVNCIAIVNRFITPVAKIDRPDSDYVDDATSEKMPPTWRVVERPDEGDWLVSYDKTPSVPMTTKVQVATVCSEDLAQLLAAAGTAAAELPEKYDPVEAIKLLPLLLEAFEEGHEGQLAFSKELWDALIAARGDSDE